MKSVVIISEGTGLTARRLLDAILAHYPEELVNSLQLQVHAGLRTAAQLEAVLENMPPDSLLLFSVIAPELAEFCRRELARRKLSAIDVLQPMREIVREFLGEPADYEGGRLQSSRGAYYRKMDAIGFSVEHDDGLGSRHREADVILVGPSRTVKTPTAMFLATHYGLKAANLSLYADQAATERLLTKLSGVAPARVFGMIMKPELLTEVRSRRLDMFVTGAGQKRKLRAYHDIEAVKKEVTFCRRLYLEQDWETIEVGGRSVEDIAKQIVEELADREPG